MIRKISVGSDTQNQLHISHGGQIGGNTVAQILKPKDFLYEVWIYGKDNSVIKWKDFENMPVTVEYNTRID